MAARFQVTFDSADPDKLATFWAAALGYKLQDPPTGFDTWEAFLDSIGVPPEARDKASAIVDPGETLPRIYFQKVPEPKAGKNRLHLDLNMPEARGVSAELRRERLEARAAGLVAIGATKIGWCEEDREDWIVMQDPEGNEFCIQ